MIVEWFIDFVASAIGTLLEGLPDIEGVPAIGSVADQTAVLNAFVPVSEGIAVALFLLTVTGVMTGFRVIRIVLSHVPFVGGSG